MLLSTIYKKEVEKRIPLKTFKVKSRTNFNPDLGEFEAYDVGLWADGNWDCSCLAGGYKKPCYHKKQIQGELEKEFGSIEKAIETFRNKHK